MENKSEHITEIDILPSKDVKLVRRGYFTFDNANKQPYLSWIQTSDCIGLYDLT